MGAWKAKPDTIYFTDNAALYCGEHLGASAGMTGRDISGQRITAATKPYIEQAGAMGTVLKCEQCGKEAK